VFREILVVRKKLIGFSIASLMGVFFMAGSYGLKPQPVFYREYTSGRR
jgi:hypothetical protein